MFFSKLPEFMVLRLVLTMFKPVFSSYPKLCGGEFKTVDVDTAIGVSYCQGQGHKWGVKVTTLV